jgi:hypothetical protein
MKNVIIICVPLYKDFSQLSADEKLSLQQLKRILKAHPIMAICPNHLDLSEYKKFFF